MTRKDYDLLARTISDEIATCLGQSENISAKAVAYYAENLATALASENPRFDRDRFLNACGHGVPRIAGVTDPVRA